MITIVGLSVEHSERSCVTDNPHPRFSYAVRSDRSGVVVDSARLAIGDWTCEVDDQTAVVYGGKPLRPFTEYRVTLDVNTTDGEHAHAETTFETGRLDRSVHRLVRGRS